MRQRHAERNAAQLCVVEARGGFLKSPRDENPESLNSYAHYSLPKNACAIILNFAG
jgi:hypothetical protein